MPARATTSATPLREHLADAVQSDIRMVAGAELHFGHQLALTHQRKAGLGSSAVDAEEELGGHFTGGHFTNG